MRAISIAGPVAFVEALREELELGPAAPHLPRRSHLPSLGDRHLAERLVDVERHVPHLASSSSIDFR
jgi:hypothetical protein